MLSVSREKTSNSSDSLNPKISSMTLQRCQIRQQEAQTDRLLSTGTSQGTETRQGDSLRARERKASLPLELLIPRDTMFKQDNMQGSMTEHQQQGTASSTGCSHRVAPGIHQLGLSAG